MNSPREDLGAQDNRESLSIQDRVEGDAGTAASTFKESLQSAAANRPGPGRAEAHSSVREAWQKRQSQAENTLSNNLSLKKQLEEKLQEAEQRRTEAVARRTSGLKEVVERGQAARQRLSAQQEQAARDLRVKLDLKLSKAQSAREAVLAQRSSQASSRRTSTVQDAPPGVVTQAGIEARLHHAAAARQEVMAALRSSLPQCSGERYLGRRAYSVARLRREHSCKRIQRAWRAFVQQRGLTVDVVQNFLDLQLSHTMPENTPAIHALLNGKQLSPDLEKATKDAFEVYATNLQSPSTLITVTMLLKRLQRCLNAWGPSTVQEPTSPTAVAKLMQRLYMTTKGAGLQERHPVRVFLCAYMILQHPEVVFQKTGIREAALGTAAYDMLQSFDHVIERLHPAAAQEAATSAPPPEPPLGAPPIIKADPATPTRDLLKTWDNAWVDYLTCFVAWKRSDAANLELELIRAATDLERSMLLKLAPTQSPRPRPYADLKAVMEQVAHDHELLRTRVRRLGGAQGLIRLDAALAAVRAAVAAEIRQAAASPQQSPSRATTGTHTRSGTYGSPAGRAASPQMTQEASAGSSGAGPAPADGQASRSVTPVDHLPSAMSPVPLSNEQMVWELLHDLQWQVPTDGADQLWSDATGETDVMREGSEMPPGISPQEVSALLQRRIQRVAEQAFWDAVTVALDPAQTKPGYNIAESPTVNPLAMNVEAVVGLLADLGGELLGLLPSQAEAKAAELANLLSYDSLSAAVLSDEGVDTTKLLGILEYTARVLSHMGAPAREQAALIAQLQLRTHFTAVLDAAANGDAESAGQVAVLTTKALRLLAAQLRLMKVDVANWRLRSLASSLGGGAGLLYAKDKFEEACGVKGGTAATTAAAALPLTRAFLALASGRVTALLQDLAPLDAAVDPSERPSSGLREQPATQALPAVLRSGISTLQGPAAQRPAGPQPVAQLYVPVQSNSWRGLVRCGLVTLASQEDPVSRDMLPETLQLDAARLHAAQNDFQQLLVMTACLLFADRSKIAGQKAEDAAVVELKARLTVIVADPAVSLADLATEVARLRGSTSREAIEQVQASLSALLRRNSGGFKALCTGLSTALLMQLLSGPASRTATAIAVQQVLARCGATLLRPEVMLLAQKLSAIAAISEGVHGDIYRCLSSDLF